MLGIKVELDALESHKHDNVPASESHEISLETLVERKWALILNHVPNNTEKTGWLSWSGIHHACL